MIFGLIKKMKDDISNTDNVKILSYISGDMGDFIGALCLRSHKFDMEDNDIRSRQYFLKNESDSYYYSRYSKRWEAIDYLNGALHANPLTSNHPNFLRYPREREKVYKKIILLIIMLLIPQNNYFTIYG